ncbi:MAG: hypothetical protein Q4C99_10870, partial [Clostridia bacterium]|nr:hypothetical protein [Clostridia bacterium]
MKKSSKKNKSENIDAMKPLNDELGFFGLEPPKVYRENQVKSSYRRAEQRQSSDKKRKSQPKNLPIQSREQNVKHVKKKRKLKKKFRVAFTAVGLVLLI